MSTETASTKSKRPTILRLHYAGFGRSYIAKSVKCSPGIVDRVIEEGAGMRVRTVEPYKCAGCDAAGVYWVTNLTPCVRCAARGKR